MNGGGTIQGSVEIEFAGQAMDLLPDRAVWWPATGSLVIADLHLGKAASFRARGIPVPAGTTTRDLARLSVLLEATAAKRLVILGDFLHARAGRQPEVFEEMTRWRREHAGTEILLVRGNHDRSAGRPLAEWDIREVEEPHLDGGVWLVHHPEVEAAGPAMGGHVHPVAGLRDYDGAVVSVPCFVVEERLMILPAFGKFTGGHHVRGGEGRRVYLVMGGRVIERRA